MRSIGRDFEDVLDVGCRDFRFPDWPKKLREHRVTRVAGLRTHLGRYGYTNTDLAYDDAIGKQTMERLPASWIDQVGPFDGCNTRQLGWAFRYSHMVVHKALFAVAYFDTALRVDGKIEDKDQVGLFSGVRIRPANYTVEGFTSEFRRMLQNKRGSDGRTDEEVLISKLNDNYGLINAVVDGRLVTRKTGDLIVKALEGLGYSGLRVVSKSLSGTWGKIFEGEPAFYEPQDYGLKATDLGLDEAHLKDKRITSRGALRSRLFKLGQFRSASVAE